MGLTPQKQHLIDIYCQMLELDRKATRLIAEQKPIQDRRTLGALRDDSLQRQRHLKRCIGWIEQD